MYPADDGDIMNDTSRRRKRPLPKLGFSEPSHGEGDGYAANGWFAPLPVSQDGETANTSYHHQPTDAVADYGRPADYGGTTAERDRPRHHFQWGEREHTPHMMMERPVLSMAAPHPHGAEPAASYSHGQDAPRSSYYPTERDQTSRYMENEAYYSPYAADGWEAQAAESLQRQQMQRQQMQRQQEDYQQYVNNDNAGMLQQQHMQPPHHHQAMEYGYVPPMYFPFGTMAPAAALGQLPYPVPFPPGYAGDSSSMDASLDPKRRRAKTFPEKLMNSILENSNEDAIAWLPDGRSFVIVNPDLFTSEVLDKAFKKAKYASFIRKLHRWGFVRLTSGTGTDCFYHPLFTLNDPDQASNINCTPPQDRVGDTGEDHRKPSLAGVERFIRAKLAAASATKDALRSAPMTRPRDAERVVTQQPDDLSSLSHENDSIRIREVPSRPEAEPPHESRQETTLPPPSEIHPGTTEPETHGEHLLDLTQQGNDGPPAPVHEKSGDQSTT